MCHGRADVPQPRIHVVALAEGLSLARTAGLDALKGAQNARAALERAAAAGNGKKYFPVLVKAL
jgi:hypothetical protein